MRVALAVREGMVFPVAGNPLLGHDGRREPEPKSHRQRREVMEAYTTMSLRPMQEERHADVGYVAGDNDEDNWHPPFGGQIPEPWHHKLHVLVRLNRAA